MVVLCGGAAGAAELDDLGALGPARFDVVPVAQVGHEQVEPALGRLGGAHVGHELLVVRVRADVHADDARGIGAGDVVGVGGLGSHRRVQRGQGVQVIRVRAQDHQRFGLDDGGGRRRVPGGELQQLLVGRQHVLFERQDRDVVVHPDRLHVLRRLDLAKGELRALGHRGHHLVLGHQKTDELTEFFLRQNLREHLLLFLSVILCLAPRTDCLVPCHSGCLWDRPGAATG